MNFQYPKKNSSYVYRIYYVFLKDNNSAGRKEFDDSLCYARLQTPNHVHHCSPFIREETLVSVHSHIAGTATNAARLIAEPMYRSIVKFMSYYSYWRSCRTLEFFRFWMHSLAAENGTTISFTFFFYFFSFFIFFIF